VAIAKANGAKIIAIVGNPRSALAEAADVVLTIASSEAPLKSGSMITRLCQLAMVDLLTLGIAMGRKEEILEQFGRNQQLISHRTSQ
jgi:DNA-binding MurR/RpiR family transcriptional regulator